MSEFIMVRQFASIQRRTNGSLVASAVVHAALLLLLLAGHRAAPESLGLAEITWVQGAEPEGEPDAAPPVAREETKSAPVADVATRTVSREAKTTEHFERDVMQSSVSPSPQASSAVSDLVAARLDTWEHDAKSNKTRVAALVSPPRVGVPALAGAPGAPPGASGPSGELRRGGTGNATPGVLQRSAPSASASAPPVLAAVPDPSPTRAAAPAQNESGVRELAGAQLVGPVADRPLLSHRVPVYPEWAKRDGVEASVTLYFRVLPDGRVKENIVVERTGGFEDFDRGALDALRAWRFQAIPGSAEQWGRITFNFRLSDVQ